MRSIFVLLILVMIGLNGKGQSVTALPDSVLSQCCLEVTLLNGNVTTVDWVFIQYITRDGTGTKLFVEYAPNFGGIQWETQIRIQDDFDDVLERSKFIVIPFTVGSTDYGINRNWIANIEENTTTGGTWIYGRFGTPTKRKFSAVEDYETMKNLLLACRPRAIVVAENGLYTDGDTVRMGGFLIENTSITTEGYNWQMKDTLSSVEFGLDYLTPETLDTTVYWARRHGSLRQMVQLGRRYYYNSMRDTTGGLYSDFTHSWNSGDPFLQYQVFNPLDVNSGTAWFKIQKDNAFLVMSNETTNPYYTPGLSITNNNVNIGVNESGSGDPGNGVGMGAYGFGTTEYLYMITKGVDDNTATNGQFLQLIDNSSGEVDFATIDLSAYLPIADTAAMLDPYIQGAGTTNNLVKFTGSRVVGNAAITENGSRVVMGLPMQLKEYSLVGLPTGVAKDMYYVTSSGPAWHDGTRLNYIPKSDRSAFTSTYIPFANSSGQLTEDPSLTHSESTGQTTLTKNQNAGTLFRVNNSTTGTAAWAGFYAQAGSNAADNGVMYKISSGYTTYKNQVGGDLGFYNGGARGNIALLNDYTSGNFNVAVGGSSTAQLTLESDGDLRLTGKVGVGISPSEQIDVLGSLNGFFRLKIKNNSTGTAAYAGSHYENSLINSSLTIFKTGTGYTTYKSLKANDSGIYNAGAAGDISILNDYTSGNINFSAGASSSVQMVLMPSGRLGIGNTSPQRTFHVTGEARITDLTTDTPTRIVGADADGDLGELSLSGLSITGGVLSSTWLKPQLEAGSVTINAVTNADLFINNLDSVKFGKTLIRSSNNSLLILNPDVGASGISTFGAGYHTVINGILNGTDGGTGHIILGGSVTANTTGTTFAMSLGYSSNVNNAYGLGVGYNADVTADNAAAFGRNSLADEVGEFSLGSSIYSKINLWTNTGDIFAKGDVIAEDSVKVTTRPNMPAATDIAVYDASGWLGYRDVSTLSNGIYSGSGTLASHTTRARVPDDGNLYFSQTYNSGVDSSFFYFQNAGGGERYVGLGLTDTASTGGASLLFGNDGGGEMSFELQTIDAINGNTQIRGIGGDLVLSSSAGNVSLSAQTTNEVQVTGLVRAKQEAYYEITSTSSPQTFSNVYSDNYVNQGSTQASFTFDFPLSPENGQILMITWGNAISTVTLNGNGNTITGTAVTTATAGTRRMFKFYGASNTWIKIF